MLENYRNLLSLGEAVFFPHELRRDLWSMQCEPETILDPLNTLVGEIWIPGYGGSCFLVCGDRQQMEVSYPCMLEGDQHCIIQKI